MSGRKTVLIVDDDPGILRVLSDGLSNTLDLFDVVTATNGQEAVQELERRSVDVLVTDLAMPVMDGFALIAYVTNQRSTLPVVVLSGMVGSMLDQRLAGYGGLRVLRKPASYQEVATCVLEEIERVDRGLIEGIPLSGVLQLVEAERRSGRVVVSSGRRRGHLDFESGRLINAFSDDFGAEGEAAAYDILAWPDTVIEFAPLPATARRFIHTPMQLLLVELAAAQDREREEALANPPADEETAEDERDQGIREPRDTVPPPEVDVPGPDAVDDEQAPFVGAADDAPVPAAVARALGADEPAPLDDTPGAIDTAAAGEAWADASPEEPAAAPPSAQAAAPAVVPAAAVPASAHAVSGTHVHDLLAAIERLATRAKAADDALAAVAAEIDAFRDAQRRFDTEMAQRERRRRDLERFRDEVGQLAREILGRVDGLFDAMAGDAAPRDAGGERSAT